MSINPRRDFIKLAAATLSAPALSLAEAPSHKPRPTAHHEAFYNIRTFGALGDARTIDSPAINAAIAAASAAGGGTVFFPAGNYLSYSIRLKSNISLYLDQGAVLIAADAAPEGQPSYDFPETNQPWEAFQDYGHNHWKNSLIWGIDLQNISILGPGRIWGRGLSRNNGPQLKSSPADKRTDGVGNKTIALKNCVNVQLRDFQILKGGWFCLLATGVDNLTIHNLTLDTDRDGFDIDCCRNVRVSNCAINSPWDDAIVPKSSYALGYLRPSENITISDCYVSGCWQLGTFLDGTRLPFPAGGKVYGTGRIKLGTESNGGFKNITITNCIFEGCQGLALETVDGAICEDITISNITMRNIISAPIFMRLGSRLRGPAADGPMLTSGSQPEGTKTGVLRRVYINNIVCSNSVSKLGCVITGVPNHPIEDIRIQNVLIHHQGGGTADQSSIHLEEKENAYPEPGMFGTSPSHGIFIRHVRNIEVSDVRILAATPDARPTFHLEDVDTADFHHVAATNSTGPTFALENVRNLTISRTKGVKDFDEAAPMMRTI